MATEQGRAARDDQDRAVDLAGIDRAFGAVVDVELPEREPGGRERMLDELQRRAE